MAGADPPLAEPPAFRLLSLDHLIRPEQHRLRNRQADLLRRLEINHQLELRWLLYWKVGGLGAFKIS